MRDVTLVNHKKGSKRMPPFEELKVFSGTAHRKLAQAVCDYLNVPLGKSNVFKFRNDNTFVQFEENIRERDVFIVQPFSVPVNDHIMELLIMIDAAKRASAGRITAVIPYYAYGRTDKKDQPRVPITGRLIADLLSVAGADRVLTLDLHAGQIQGFFDVPVDELTALGMLSTYFKDLALKDAVVAAVDIGITKRARNLASDLGVPLAIVEKRRLGNEDGVESMNVIGDVAGRPVIAFDDEIDTAGSLVAAINTLKEAGATEAYACCTHAVFTDPAITRIGSTEFLKKVVITDTLPLAEFQQHPKIETLSVAPWLGEAIQRIHKGLSVGAMFE